MLEAPLPADEAARLATLANLNLLDTPPETRFDRITRFAARLFDAPVSLISLIDAERQWFKSSYGLDISETPRAFSFCAHAILRDEVMVVPDTLLDERFAGNPYVAGPPFIRFYAGCPVSALDGSRLGTLCIVDYRPRQMSEDDVQKLCDVALWVQHEIVSGELNRALRQAQEDVQAREHQALHDPLTGLPNRALLYNCLQQAISIGRREDTPFALLLMDLDRFKEVNDTLGHQRGDLLLRQIGPRLRNVLRDSDTLARLGGDEFAVVLPHTGANQATLVAQKILHALQEAMVVEGLSMEIGASIGIALYPEHGDEADLLMQRADAAMYEAKQNGGYAVYAALYDHRTVHRLALIGELRQAIEHEQLVLHYQPKVSITTGEVAGVEALVRWQHPQHGLIAPDQFIPVAERTGLINRLTLWVLDAALRQGRAWHEAGLPVGIAVNLSVQNLQNGQLLDQIGQLLHATGFAPQYLELEITESVMSDPARVTDMLMRLSELGVRLSVDGFGTGYSSLSYLRKPPVDEIKIGQSFVTGMAMNEDDAVIVRQIIDLAHAFGIKVVGEGVETREVLDRLAGLSCDFAQGYYLGGPLPAAQITGRLRQRLVNIN
ncbi:MAG: EAL domain-containing protein [Gammaproteobacteria bacterium]|nr:MAG: EAL domain-containing protein [Gammaproteobacteria bacterium]